MTMHYCTDAYMDISYTSPLSSGVLRVSVEADASTHKPQMNYLQRADAVVVSANLIKPAETHHFIWHFIVFGLAFDLLITPQLFGSADE